MSITDEEEEMEEQNEQQPEASHDCSKKVFEVTCGTLAGTLYKKRFASGNHISLHTQSFTVTVQNVSPLSFLSPPGTCGKSIRTEKSWMTPVEFVEGASGQTYASWRRDIMWEGKPLSVLTEVTMVRVVL